VLAGIEPLRKDKRIGSSLQARVVLTTSKDDGVFLEKYRKDLPMLFIVSEVTLRAGADPDTTIVIERADGVKCERCWRVVASVSSDPAWAGICDRCEAALAPSGSRGAQPANA
jgi:isoleucyl-tRNA synthetase